MPVDNGTGTTITFGTSGFTASVTSITPVSGAERPSIDTTHLGTTTARTSIPGDLIDWGTCEIAFQFDPDNRPPIDQAAETITVTFPLSSGGSTAANLAGSGYMTGYGNEVPLEELMTAEATIKWSGDLTFTAEV
ncbi:MAG: hypothetical protein EBY40_00200 [Marivivens sp.]|nr:hypothetical protein [Marivivens sp.]NBT50024.1 hypothetical protein [Marivivens sp.]NCW67028.1 hypothetical protein [Marivivens sp.]NDH01530.1 hypothetical protein [Marivivens sp.]